MYGQHNEEEILEKYFIPGRNTRTYVDVGAFSPDEISNTYKYYMEGGSGILVEPCPLYHEELRVKRPRDILVKEAIHNYNGKCNMLTTVTMDSPLGPIYTKEVDKPIYTVDCITMDTLIKRYPEYSEPDFMNMDIETNEFNALSRCDFNVFKPHVIVIEYLLRGVDYRTVWGKFLEPFYEFKEALSCNAFYVRKNA